MYTLSAIESLAYPHYLDSVKESLDNERSLPDICDPSPIVSERLPLDASDDQEEAKASTSRAPTTLPNLLSSCNTSSSLSSICTQISSDLRPSEKSYQSFLTASGSQISIMLNFLIHIIFRFGLPDKSAQNTQPNALSRKNSNQKRLAIS